MPGGPHAKRGASRRDRTGPGRWSGVGVLGAVAGALGVLAWWPGEPARQRVEDTAPRVMPIAATVAVTPMQGTFAAAPGTLGELLALPVEELAGVEIGWMNLVCAVGR